MSPKGNHTMPRVLVIDDQPGVRATISLVLQAEGFEVMAVESGQLGLNEFHKSYFDLVIVDIFMPEMDGVKLIKALRARIPTQPIMAISGVQLRASGRTALDLFAMAPEYGGDALPDEDAAAGRLRDGAARIGLQSHSRHEHHRHSAAHDGNQGLVKAGNGSHCRFAKMRSFRKGVLTQPRPIVPGLW
jgi:CheY-like chemotaxis protein